MQRNGLVSPKYQSLKVDLSQNSTSSYAAKKPQFLGF